MCIVIRPKRKRWIGKHKVKCRVRRAVEKGGDILRADRSRKPRLCKVGADGGDGPAMAVHKSTRSSSAAERLDAKRPAAGKKIKRMRPGNSVAETRKDGTTHAIHHRPRDAIRTDKPQPARASGNYAHR